MSIPGLLHLRLDVQPNEDGWFKENFYAAKLEAERDAAGPSPAGVRAQRA